MKHFRQKPSFDLSHGASHISVRDFHFNATVFTRRMFNDVGRTLVQLAIELTYVHL